MSPATCSLEGSPTMHQSMCSSRFNRVSTTFLVPSTERRAIRFRVSSSVADICCALRSCGAHKWRSTTRLIRCPGPRSKAPGHNEGQCNHGDAPRPPEPDTQLSHRAAITARIPAPSTARPRSEEHTSELQSHSDLVCRLLLEKKKN